MAEHVLDVAQRVTGGDSVTGRLYKSRNQAATALAVRGAPGLGAPRPEQMIAIRGRRSRFLRSILRSPIRDRPSDGSHSEGAQAQMNETIPPGPANDAEARKGVCEFLSGIGGTDKRAVQMAGVSCDQLN